MLRSVFREQTEVENAGVRALLSKAVDGSNNLLLRSACIHALRRASMRSLRAVGIYNPIKTIHKKL